MPPFPRRVVPRAGFDAVGVVVVGFGAGDGSGCAGILLLLLIDGGLQVDDRWGPAAVDVGVEVLFFVLVEVGARVRGFVFEHFHEAVEGGGEEGAEDGTDPVDLRGVVVRACLDAGGMRVTLPNDSGGMYGGPLQGQRIELGLLILQCRRHLKQSE